MTDILDTIVSRRSVKKYTNEPVAKELIDKVITAGIHAPTGKNMQSPIILAITNKEIIKTLSSMLAEIRNTPNMDPFYGAPVALVVLAKKDIFTHVYDGSCVLENMLLEAHSLGLGACWIHHAKIIFETEFGKNLLQSLGITEEYEGIGTCILGHAEIYPQGPLPKKENYVYYVE